MPRSAPARPMVTVLLSPTVVPPRDTECADVPGGPQVETYLARDVPRWVDAHLRTDGHWAVTGASTGGFCATKLSTRHPDVFAASVALSGYVYPPPLHPPHRRAVRARPPAAASQRPHLAAAARPALHVSYLLTASLTEREVYPQLLQLPAAVVRPPATISTIVLPSGGHNFGVWHSELPAALRWLPRKARARAGLRVRGPGGPGRLLAAVALAARLSPAATGRRGPPRSPPPPPPHLGHALAVHRAADHALRRPPAACPAPAPARAGPRRPELTSVPDCPLHAVHRAARRPAGVPRSRAGRPGEPGHRRRDRGRPGAPAGRRRPPARRWRAPTSWSSPSAPTTCSRPWTGWDSALVATGAEQTCVGGRDEATLDQVGADVGTVLDRVAALRRGRRPGRWSPSTGTCSRTAPVGAADRGTAYLRGSDALTRRLNRHLCTAAQAHGATCVDLYTAFKGDGRADPTRLLANDGDHPDAAGHALMPARCCAPCRPAGEVVSLTGPLFLGLVAR